MQLRETSSFGLALTKTQMELGPNVDHYPAQRRSIKQSAYSSFLVNALKNKNLQKLIKEPCRKWRCIGRAEVRLVFLRNEPYSRAGLVLDDLEGQIEKDRRQRMVLHQNGLEQPPKTTNHRNSAVRKRRDPGINKLTYSRHQSQSNFSPDLLRCAGAMRGCLCPVP